MTVKYTKTFHFPRNLFQFLMPRMKNITSENVFALWKQFLSLRLRLEQIIVKKLFAPCSKLFDIIVNIYAVQSFCVALFFSCSFYQEPHFCWKHETRTNFQAIIIIEANIFEEISSFPDRFYHKEEIERIESDPRITKFSSRRWVSGKEKRWKSSRDNSKWLSNYRAMTRFSVINSHFHAHHVN